MKTKTRLLTIGFERSSGKKKSTTKRVNKMSDKVCVLNNLG